MTATLLLSAALVAAPVAPVRDAPANAQAGRPGAATREQGTPALASPSTVRPRLPPLTVAGIAVMSTAAVGVGLLITGLVQGSLAKDDYRRGPTRVARDQAESTGAKANTLAFVGGLSAGILLGVGAALVVLGQRVDKHDHAKRLRPGAGGFEVRF